MSKKIYLIDEEINSKVWSLIKSYIPEEAIEIRRKESDIFQDLKINSNDNHIPANLLKEDKLLLHDVILAIRENSIERNIINDSRVCIFKEQDRFKIDDVTMVGAVTITTIKLNNEKAKIFIPIGLKDDYDYLYVGNYVGYDGILRNEIEKIIDSNYRFLVIGVTILNFWYSLQVVLSKTNKHLSDKESSNQTLKYRTGNSHKVHMVKRYLLNLLPILEELGYIKSEKKIKNYIGYWKIYDDDSMSLDAEKFYERVPFLKQYRKAS